MAASPVVVVAAMGRGIGPREDPQATNCTRRQPTVNRQLGTVGRLAVEGAQVEACKRAANEADLGRRTK